MVKHFHGKKRYGDEDEQSYVSISNPGEKSEFTRKSTILLTEANPALWRSKQYPVGPCIMKDDAT